MTADRVSGPDIAGGHRRHRPPLQSPVNPLTSNFSESLNEPGDTHQVKDSTDKIVHWGEELSSRVNLRRDGWPKETFKAVRFASE